MKRLRNVFSGKSVQIFSTGARVGLGQRLAKRGMVRAVESRFPAKKWRVVPKPTRTASPLRASRKESKTVAAVVQPTTPELPHNLHQTNGEFDLLSVAAELGSLEYRIGYRFTDKMLGMTVLSANAVNKLSFEGTLRPIESNRRLALLGDRVLGLLQCRIWYESGETRSKFLFFTAPRKSKRCDF